MSASGISATVGASSFDFASSVSLRFAAVEAGDDALEALAAVDGARHLDLRDVAGPALEIGAAHQRPVDARRGNLEIDRRSGIGSSTSRTGERSRDSVSQSLTVIVPSGRSAMICSVPPFIADTLTRTRR